MLYPIHPIDAPADARHPPLAAPARSAAAELYRKTPEPRALAPLTASNPERDWRDNMVRNVRQDDDGCLLSVSLGGDLDIKGYKGVRLFGRIVTLARPASKEAR
jgi:hypothetical protein